MARWPRLNRIVLLLAVLAIAVLDSSSGDSADNDGTGPIPPSVFITSPEDRSMVREPSFEITGGLGGSVTSIEVFLDGESLGPARRGEVAGDWRVPASLVSLTPGLHRISAAAVGEGGRASAGIWVFFDRDSLFEMLVEPAEATYEPGEVDRDPDLLLLGDDVPLDLTVTAPDGITADTNDRLTAGSVASLSVNVRTEEPGTYPIVVRAVADDGTERTATHTVTITGPAPTTTTTMPPPTQAAGGPVAVLFDDFEGPDQWTSEVTGTTNGSSDSAELAGGGNPGTQRRMTHVMPGTDDGDNNPTQIAVVHLFTGGGWDPSTDGALSRLNYSEDQIEFEPPFEGAAIGALFVIVQDGTRYTAEINENNAYSNLTWQTTRVDGLTPADFRPAPGPDFSAAGGPMQFGYLRANTSRSGREIVLQHGIDNWTVELFGE